LAEAEVDLPSSLSPCILPEPPTGEELKDCFLSVLKLWKVAPLDVTIPVTGAPLCSVLGDSNHSQHIFGYTGSGKTEIAIIAQSFFGSGFDVFHIPANWLSTSNSNEALAHAAKDCLLLVDDFNPTGTPTDQARYHKDADRLFRGQGNHSGRARCRADGSVRPQKPPRGLILSTGEDVPRGQSLRARLLILELKKGAMQWDRLTECQAAARNGVYAKAMSAFIQWLATDNRIADLQMKAEHEIAALREIWLKDESLSESHKKVVTALAQLAFAWKTWLRAAKELGVLLPSEAEANWQTIWKILGEVGKKQAPYQAGEHPAIRFVELIQAALSSGKAHLAAMDESKPDECKDWGWREEESKDEHGNSYKQYRAQGDRIGWIDGDDVYLQPDAAYSMAQRLSSNGEGLSVTSQTLWKRLNESRFLKSTESEDRLKVKKTVGGKRQTVIHISADIFSG
jgi:hypothetical protein